MTHREPEFSDPFLRNAYESIARRRKSLSYRGRFALSLGDQDEEYEWLTLSCQTANRYLLVVQLIERNRAHLYVQSNHARNRGKVLLRLENLFLIDNGPALVRAFEATVSAVAGFHRDHHAALEEIGAAWEAVQLRVT